MVVGVSQQAGQEKASVARGRGAEGSSPDTMVSGGGGEDASVVGIPLALFKESEMTSPISWFELPVNDLPRATAFYERILNVKLQPETCGECTMSVFPHVEGYPSGALVSMAQMVPQDNGTLVYLFTGDDLAPVLARVPAAGGTVAMPRTSIGEHGFIALFIDSEGNRVGLHSLH